MQSWKSESRFRTAATLLAYGILIATLLGSVKNAQGRYLPTRSQNDRLDRLEEMLQNLYSSNTIDPRVMSAGGITAPGSLDYPGPAAIGSNPVIFKRTSGKHHWNRFSNSASDMDNAE